MQFHTPVKVKPSSNGSDAQQLRLINSVSVSKKALFVADLMDQSREKIQLPFFSIRKEEDSNSFTDEISDEAEDQSSSGPDNEGSSFSEENYQTVKKQNGPFQAEKEPVQHTTAKMDKKVCNCPRSKCLKKYCICYKNGNICSDECVCEGCQNHDITQKHLQNAKIALKLVSEQTFKGCNCINSHCRKGYCECHKFNKKCSKLCKCKNCGNSGDSNQSEDHDKGKRERILTSSALSSEQVHLTGKKLIKTSEFIADTKTPSKHDYSFLGNDFISDKENVNIFINSKHYLSETTKTTTNIFEKKKQSTNK